MARASTHTLLALDTYAKIMGINPPHFNQAAGTTIFPVEGNCNDLWFQYSWQYSDSVSREDLARAIYDAEYDIANWLGYWPSPKWIAKEMQTYPRYFDRQYFGDGLNLLGRGKSVKTNWGKIISAGRRAVSLVGTPTVAGATLVYSDPDGDGFSELATITLNTTLTDACEIKAYFNGEGGALEWEIRPAKSKTISGGVLTMTFDSWLFIDPALWEVFPVTGGLSAILLSTSNFVTTVQVYREYADFTEPSAEFSWEPKTRGTFEGWCGSCGGTGCAQCESTIQEGCFQIRDVVQGLVVPTAGEYDSDNSQWNWLNWTDCIEPDQVKLWYYAGEIDERYLRGESCEPLSNALAHAIAWMATARLERPLCSCGNTQALANDLMKDLALLGETSYATTEDILGNPFGTRAGEVRAWKRISQLTERVGTVALA